MPPKIAKIEKMQFTRKSKKLKNNSKFKLFFVKAKILKCPSKQNLRKNVTKMAKKLKNAFAEKN